MTKFRCYDRVSIEAEVVAVRHDCIVIAIKTDSEKTNVYVDQDQLKLLSYAPPDVGDQVRHIHSDAVVHTILAVHEKAAWVKSSEGALSTVLLSNLRVVGRD